ncbi:hypothetical protein [Aliiroseovarius crassostreae]|uniref:hypothetical protein n=1 Tax=Aliiroseovarius crassostreae TaxID=154981 RepID=UPI00220C5412|nr:hypothetical protein [Aliiroseovarius crassostreae]UWP87865.1 hypothetical protein K3J57_07880 [Aliiroseovarius crassostreae]
MSLLVLIFALTFVVAFLILRHLLGWRAGAGTGARRVFRSGSCRWVQVGQSTPNLMQFRCSTCGVTAYSSQKSGPEQCKRDLAKGQSL